MKEIRCSSSNLIVPFSNLILNMHKELEFLKSFLMDPPESYVEQEKLKDISTCIGALTMETAIFCHRFDPDTLSEGLASELNSDLCRLLEKFQIVKEEIKEIYHEIPKPSRSVFPRTLRLGVIDLFLHYLDCLLIMSDDSVVLVKHEVETMKLDLVGLYSFLSDLGKKRTEDKLSQEIFTHIIQVAFEAENVIDSIISREKRLWYLMLYLIDVIEEIKIIKEQVTKIDRKVYDTINPQVGKTFTCANSLLSSATIDEVMVGFEDETERIIYQLIGGTKDLDISSIVGMPGQGKTTLAKKVYNKDLVAHHFDVHAWCCVSQEYNKAKLLYGIFRQVGNGDKPSEDDIADQLRKTLIGKRYIIVLDDVWKIAVFDDLVRSFPGGNNGSRILLTTRLDEVAENAKHCSDPHHLRLFTQEESLDLLRRKLFQNKTFPPELYSAGRQNSEKVSWASSCSCFGSWCRSRTDNKADLWREFTKNSISHIVSGEKHCTDIIELSYVHLPDHLKPRFLYFGAFLEDMKISVSKIIPLWIAEEFIQQTNGMSSEVVAQSYLEDLIASSLLIVSERRSNGGIKTFCVHDLLLDFCLSKAKELNLLQLVKQFNFFQFRAEPSKRSSRAG
ncbi:hypothetical protein HAX54_016311 [Datura stramonium]|uniref:Uncharacterized protein n=1 Tax=Datura stramonium TaxID=4076 RepID=A0ABS8UIQ4_DATST|nr:hypothetical protein [Datura stramonium]